MSMTAVVLGAGVSGLSAAYYLSKHASNKFGKILVLEASDRIGGWIQTTRFPDGTIFEHGPRSLRVSGVRAANTLELIEELRLKDEIIACLSTSPAAKQRYIYVHDKMHTLPNGFGGITKVQAPFTRPLIWYGIKEYFKKRSNLEDETVFNFMERRFGTELAKYTMDPICRGIYAGDSHQLSMLACFPEIFNMEKKYGSLLKGAMKSVKEPKVEQTSELVKKASAEKWSTWQLKHGLSTLTETLADTAEHSGKVEIRTNSRCTSLQSLPGSKIKVKTSDEEIIADHVISAVYAKDLARLLPTHEALSRPLQSIQAANVVVVNLQFEGKCLPNEGFGHLLPSFESGPILGVIYDSCSFPQHNRTEGGETTRLTLIMGGAWFKELVTENPELDEGLFLKKALHVLEKQLGITGKPSKSNVAVQKDCIPHYFLGHTAKVEAMSKYIQEQNLPLSLIGSSYLGAAVNDCIYYAKQAVLKLV